MHRIMQKALGKLTRLPGQSGREEKGAVLLRQSRDHLLHVSYEAHVEHPVDLIQDEELDSFQLVCSPGSSGPRACQEWRPGYRLPG